MRDLKFEEVQEVSGAGWLADLFDDAAYIYDNLDVASFYQDGINALTDMMCIATGNC